MFKFLLLMLIAVKTQAMPNVCTMFASSQFDSCFDISTTTTTCGWPPRPCVRISYYLPSHFIEVVSNPAETFFESLPFASFQLENLTDRVPFGAQDDNGSFSFHSHTLPAVSYTHLTLPTIYSV